MKTSDKGIELVKKFEGCNLVAYRCPAGVLTIGYGHTRDVMHGQTITQAEANKYLAADLHTAERAVTSLVRASLSQNQFDALVDFTFNVGVANFKNSTLLKKINYNPEDVIIADEFRKWKWATVGGGKVILPGLVKRREAEARMYFGKEE